MRLSGVFFMRVTRSDLQGFPIVLESSVKNNIWKKNLSMHFELLKLMALIYHKHHLCKESTGLKHINYISFTPTEQSIFAGRDVQWLLRSCLYPIFYFRLFSKWPFVISKVAYFVSVDRKVTTKCIALRCVDC